MKTERIRSQRLCHENQRFENVLRRKEPVAENILFNAPKALKEKGRQKKTKKNGMKK